MRKYKTGETEAEKAEWILTNRLFGYSLSSWKIFLKILILKLVVKSQNYQTFQKLYHQIFEQTLICLP